MAVLATALLLAACGRTPSDGGSTDSPPDPPGGHPVDLDGQTFASTTVDGHDLVAGTAVALTFTDGRISVNAGCNTQSGPYQIDGDTLTLPDELMTTLMGCEQTLMDQDTWLNSWLRTGLTVTRDGTTLTLAGDGVAMTLTSDRSGSGPGIDQGLAGLWRLDTIVDGDTATNVPAGVEPPRLRIEGDEISLFAGCNSGTGPVEVGPSTLTVDPLAMTEVACTGDTAAVEARVILTITGTVPYTRDGDTLTIGPPEASLIWRRA